MLIKKYSTYHSLAKRQKNYHLAKWQIQNFMSKIQYYHVDKFSKIYCGKTIIYPVIKYFS